MTTEQLFRTVHAARGYFLQHVKDLSPDQLLAQPPGTNHNILWNIGHIVYTNASVCYGPAGQALPVPQNYEQLFKGGTSPKNWSSTPDIAEVLSCFKRQNAALQQDYAAGKFANYKPLPLAPGYIVESFDDANAFNCFHEGIHVGMVMKLRQLQGLK